MKKYILFLFVLMFGLGLFYLKINSAHAVFNDGCIAGEAYSGTTGQPCMSTDTGGDLTPSFVSEKVNCIFTGSNATGSQSCYTTTTGSNQYRFSGVGSAPGVIYGYSGETLAWRSSCGGTASSTFGKKSEDLTFVCGNIPIVTPPIVYVPPPSCTGGGSSGSTMVKITSSQNIYDKLFPAPNCHEHGVASDGSPTYNFQNCFYSGQNVVNIVSSWDNPQLGVDWYSFQNKPPAKGNTTGVRYFDLSDPINPTKMGPEEVQSTSFEGGDWAGDFGPYLSEYTAAASKDLSYQIMEQSQRDVYGWLDGVKRIIGNGPVYGLIEDDSGNKVLLSQNGLFNVTNMSTDPLLVFPNGQTGIMVDTLSRLPANYPSSTAVGYGGKLLLSHNAFAVINGIDIAGGGSKMKVFKVGKTSAVGSVDISEINVQVLEGGGSSNVLNIPATDADYIVLLKRPAYSYGMDYATSYAAQKIFVYRFDGTTLTKVVNGLSLDIGQITASTPVQIGGKAGLMTFNSKYLGLTTDGYARTSRQARVYMLSDLLAGTVKDVMTNSPVDTTDASSYYNDGLTHEAIHAATYVSGDSSYVYVSYSQLNGGGKNISVFKLDPGGSSSSGSFHFTTLLKKGSTGNEVMELQKYLTSAGYTLGTADGNFGAMTEAAVIKFQLSKGLTGDGVVGSATRAYLNSGSSNCGAPNPGNPPPAPTVGKVQITAAKNISDTLFPGSTNSICDKRLYNCGVAGAKTFLKIVQGDDGPHLLTDDSIFITSNSQGKTIHDPLPLSDEPEAFRPRPAPKLFSLSDPLNPSNIDQVTTRMQYPNDFVSEATKYAFESANLAANKDGSYQAIKGEASLPDPTLIYHNGAVRSLTIPWNDGLNGMVDYNNHVILLTEGPRNYDVTNIESRDTQKVINDVWNGSEPKLVTKDETTNMEEMPSGFPSLGAGSKHIMDNGYIAELTNPDTATSVSCTIDCKKLQIFKLGQSGEVAHIDLDPGIVGLNSTGSAGEDMISVSSGTDQYIFLLGGITQPRADKLYGYKFNGTTLTKVVNGLPLVDGWFVTGTEIKIGNDAGIFVVSFDVNSKKRSARVYLLSDLLAGNVKDVLLNSPDFGGFGSNKITSLIKDGVTYIYLSTAGYTGDDHVTNNPIFVYKLESSSAVSPVVTPTVTISANPTSVSANRSTGGTSTITWSSTNATSCYATQGDHWWGGSRGTSGSYTTDPLLTGYTTSDPPDNHIFPITCFSANSSVSATATVSVQGTN